MIDPNLDGVEHINIYLKGKTLVGRMLSNLYTSWTIIPGVGTFKTIEGYWYWLGLRDARLMSLGGFEAKKLGREIQQRTHLVEHVSDFEYRIKCAIWYKITQNEEIKQRVLESTLRFEHYYNYSGKAVELPKYKWLVDSIEDLRKILKERSE